MTKYLKVMFGYKDVNFEYKIDEVNIAENGNEVYNEVMNILYDIRNN